MKLTTLINMFKNGETLENFCTQQAIDPTTEVIEVFMEEPLILEANLKFIPLETSKGKIKYSENNIAYTNLFDFFYFLDVIADYKQLSAEELAPILLNYAIKDA